MRWDEMRWWDDEMRWWWIERGDIEAFSRNERKWSVGLTCWVWSSPMWLATRLSTTLEQTPKHLMHWKSSHLLSPHTLCWCQQTLSGRQQFFEKGEKEASWERERERERMRQWLFNKGKKERDQPHHSWARRGMQIRTYGQWTRVQNVSYHHHNSNEKSTHLFHCFHSHLLLKGGRGIGVVLICFDKFLFGFGNFLSLLFFAFASPFLYFFPHSLPSPFSLPLPPPPLLPPN